MNGWQQNISQQFLSLYFKIFVYNVFELIKNNYFLGQSTLARSEHKLLNYLTVTKYQ